MNVSYVEFEFYLRRYIIKVVVLKKYIHAVLIDRVRYIELLDDRMEFCQINQKLVLKSVDKYNNQIHDTQNDVGASLFALFYTNEIKMSKCPMRINLTDIKDEGVDNQGKELDSGGTFKCQTLKQFDDFDFEKWRNK